MTDLLALLIVAGIMGVAAIFCEWLFDERIAPMLVKALLVTCGVIGVVVAAARTLF